MPVGRGNIKMGKGRGREPFAWLAMRPVAIHPEHMPTVLVISSYVAASRVGGAIAPYVLGPMKIEAVHVPTTLFGRHPGLGAPGGEPVEAETMLDMLDGVAADGLYSRLDAIVTGYFANPTQIAIAARAIDDVRAARGPGNRPIVLVDPIMGDTGGGLFVPEETALALAEHMVPRADLVACNHWEFQRLAGAAPKLEDVIEAAQAQGGDWLVGSIPFRGRMANVLASEQRVHAAACDIVPEPVPKGTGDLFRLVYLGQRLTGANEVDAMHRAIGCVEMVLQLSKGLGARGLPLAAASALFAAPSAGGFVIAPQDGD